MADFCHTGVRSKTRAEGVGYSLFLRGELKEP